MGRVKRKNGSGWEKKEMKGGEEKRKGEREREKVRERALHYTLWRFR